MKVKQEPIETDPLDSPAPDFLLDGRASFYCALGALTLAAASVFCFSWVYTGADMRAYGLALSAVFLVLACVLTALGFTFGIYALQEGPSRATPLVGIGLSVFFVLTLLLTVWWLKAALKA